MRGCAIVCDEFPAVVERRREIEEAIMGRTREALEATSGVREEEARFGVSQAAAEVIKSLIKRGEAGRTPVASLHPALLLDFSLPLSFVSRFILARPSS
eukprot:767405-Hanusia_phi.AAC.1